MLSCLQLLPVQPELPGAGLGRVQGGLQHHLHQHLGRLPQGGVGVGVGYNIIQYLYLSRQPEQSFRLN